MNELINVQHDLIPTSQPTHCVLEDANYWNKLRFWLLRQGMTIDAVNELFSQLFFDILKKSEKFESERHVRNWAWKAAMLRSKGVTSRLRIRAVNLDSDEFVDLAKSDEAGFDQIDNKDLLDAIKQLDNDSYDVLYMRYALDLPLREVAAELGLASPNGAAQRIKRALEQVRDQLGIGT